MSLLTFIEPWALSNPALYERFGAIIKDRATGQIVGHVQELSGWNLISKLPIPGGNPLDLVTQGVELAQLHRIQHTLNTVQTLATVGAVASVASLGVAVAGFAAVLKRLSRMEGKLDQAIAQLARVRRVVEHLHVKVDCLATAVLRARLEEVSMARLYAEPRRRDSLRDSVEKLAELRHYYGLLLASHEFCALGTDNLLALLDTQERLVAACQGELLAEFLLNEDPAVIAQRWQHQKLIFDAMAWRSRESLYQLTEQGDRDANVFMVTTAEERRAKVIAVEEIRSESISRLASFPTLAQFLHEEGVTAAEYIRLVEDGERTEEPLVIVVRASSPEALRNTAG